MVHYGSNWNKTTIEVLILGNLVANIIPKQLIDLYVSAKVYNGWVVDHVEQ
jgi:hypothetical protein